MSSSDEDEFGVDFISHALKKGKEEHVRLEAASDDDLFSISPSKKVSSSAKETSEKPVPDEPVSDLTVTPPRSDGAAAAEEGDTATPPPRKVTRSSARGGGGGGGGRRGATSSTAGNRKTSLALKKLERIQKRVRESRQSSSGALSDDEDDDLDEQKGEEGRKFELKFEFSSDIVRETVAEGEYLGRVFQRVAARLGEEVADLEFRVLGEEQSSRILDEMATARRRSLSVTTVVNVRKLSAQSQTASQGIGIRFQTRDDGRCSEAIQIGKFDPLLKAMQRYAECKGVPVRSVRFQLDGEDLQGGETPQELDIDDEAVIDVFPI